MIASARMPDITGAARSVLATIISDEAWQDIGFDKCPRYGSFVQLARAKWNVELEKRILQEMASILAAAHIVALDLHMNQADQLIALLIGGAERSGNLWQAFGYRSLDEAAHLLTTSVDAYVTTPASEWPELLAQRTNAAEVADEKLRAKLLVGTIQFALTVSDMVGIVREHEAT